MVLPAHSQLLEPVKWKFTIEKDAENENLYNFFAKAAIDKSWHLYSIDLPEGNISIPTQFVFEENANIELVGTVKELSEVIETEDPLLNTLVRYFSNEAIFQQKINVLNYNTVIKGYVEFMACDDTQCLPPDYVEFEMKIPVSTVKKDKTTAQNNSESKSLWNVFLLSLLGGLAALLLPCVYPMIPVTVSFFIRNANNKAKALRDGFFYGITIIFAYVVLGLIVSLIFGPQALSSLAASPAFNIFFFLLLVFFAASFFGAFDLTLPSKWSNSLDSKVDKTSGIVSVIFMGLTFVIVSFSCTGPVVGYLLVEATTEGNLLSPAVGMFGFSLAMAIPFTLFAIFPAAMKSLPKSGGWMNSVKVVLGFIVLAFSLKYLSSADASAGWKILDREIFLAIWITLFFLMGLYLMGKIKFAHDSEVTHIGIFRLLLIICTFSFVFYLIPGLWGAPLKAVSSFLPSVTTQDFDLSKGFTGGNLQNNTTIITDNEKMIQGPYGLIKYIDYNAGIEAAKQENKPVLLYFTGIVCTNCKKMETSVWSDPNVINLLKQYIIIALYTDERKSLPETEQYVSKQTGKKIKTAGAKWADLQIERYQNNSQPFYAIIDHNENQLMPSRGYNSNVNEYVNFLKKGVENFKSGKNEK